MIVFKNGRAYIDGVPAQEIGAKIAAASNKLPGGRNLTANEVCFCVGCRKDFPASVMNDIRYNHDHRGYSGLCGRCKEETVKAQAEVGI